MRLNYRIIALMVSAAALATSSAITGCAGDELVYDPYWHDYHRWSRGEDSRYRRWEMGSNRVHVDFPDLTPGDQLAYWSWRHGADTLEAPGRRVSTPFSSSRMIEQPQIQ